MNFEKILVINLGGIGDLLLSGPAIRALKAGYPQSQFFLLSTRRGADLVMDQKVYFPFDEVYVFEFGLCPIKILSNFKTLLSLRKKRIGLAVNMRTLVTGLGALKIRFLLSVINPGKKSGRDTDGRGKFFNISIAESGIGDKPEMEYDIDVAQALGAKDFDRNLQFNINENSTKEASVILEERLIKPGDVLIGIYPGGKPSHRWPVESLAKAMDLIVEKVNCKFLIIGTMEEAKIGDKLLRLTKSAEVINLCGNFGFGTLGSLVKRCAVNISNDTGTMHIIAILQRPLVAIFGPGYLGRFNPQNIFREAVVLYKKTGCAPCDKVNCASLECLSAIAPDEVASSVIDLLKKGENA